MRAAQGLWQGGPGRRLSDLARAVELNKTTAFRLLSALESTGLVERTPDGDAYRLGAEVTRLGEPGAGQPGAAGGGAAHAAGPGGRHPRDHHPGGAGRRRGADPRRGGGQPRHRGDALAGHALAGPRHLDRQGAAGGAADRELQRRTRAPAGLVHAADHRDPAALRRELLRVRERGYATSVEELEPGFVAVGAPVRAADGTVIAAVSVGGPRSRFSPAGGGAHRPRAARRPPTRISARCAPDPAAEEGHR